MEILNRESKSRANFAKIVKMLVFSIVFNDFLRFFFDFLMFGEIFREVLTIQKTGPLVKSQL